MCINLISKFIGDSIMSKMSGGEALVNSLVREGVDVIFGLPGVQMYGVVSSGLLISSPLGICPAFMCIGYP